MASNLAGHVWLVPVSLVACLAVAACSGSEASVERSWESYCGHFRALLEERELLSDDPDLGPESKYFDANDQEELARRAPDDELSEAHRTIAELRPSIDEAMSGERLPDPGTDDIDAMLAESNRYVAATKIVIDALVECDVLPAG